MFSGAESKHSIPMVFIQIVLLILAGPYTACVQHLPVAGSTVSSPQKETGIAGLRILKVFTTENAGVSLYQSNQVFEDSSGRIWVIGSFTRYLYDPDTDSWTNFTSDEPRDMTLIPTTIGQTTDNTVWFVSGTPMAPYLCYFSGGKLHTLDRKALPKALCECLCEVSDLFPNHEGGLWFATGTCLISYDGKRRLRMLKLPNMQDGVTFIRGGLQDSNQYIWIPVGN